MLPVSGLAASAYLAMLLCSFSIGSTNSAPVRHLAWRVLLLLAGTAAGSAVWFTMVQKWVIGAFCPYCMATHLTSLFVAALVIWRAPRASADNSTVLCRPPSVVRHLPAVLRPPSPFFAGVVLAAILALAQIAVAPAPTYRAGEAQPTQAAIDPHAVPLVGSPDARYVVTLLFDYKCPHCQQLHLMLGEAIRRYGGQLAFALCPAPLSRQCNPYVPRDVDEFKDSCELARLALTVWRADRTKFPAFEDWMYSFDSGDRWHPRTLDAAKAKAIEFVGTAKFEAAARDGWVEQYLRTSVRLYGETMQNGTGGVPKLIFGPHWVSPQPTTPADLVAILQTSLGVPKP